jgi:autotransporter-associated beta strand protein
VINSNSTLFSQGGNNNIVSGAWSGSSVATLNIVISATGTFTLGGNMTGFSGNVALGTSGGFFRFNGSTGSANTSFDLGTGIATLNNRNGNTITLGSLAGGSGTFLNGAGSSDGASLYIVGGKNLSTTFAGTIKDSSALRTTAITKVGTGTWTISGANTYSGATTVSAGKLIVNGNQSGAINTVTVASAGTLGGNGVIGGDTTISGTLAPGSSIGTLSFNGNLTFNATGIAAFEISKNPFAYDQATVGGTVSYSGTLNVVNTSIETFEAGDNFPIFTASNYTGAFSIINLPSLDAGLAWKTNRLAVNGSLWVVSTAPPTITNPSSDGVSFSFTGTGGTPNWSYDVLSSTNITQPFALWDNVTTGQFDGAGNFYLTTPLTLTEAQRFYILRPQ